MPGAAGMSCPGRVTLLHAVASSPDAVSGNARRTSVSFVYRLSLAARTHRPGRSIPEANLVRRGPRRPHGRVPCGPSPHRAPVARIPHRGTGAGSALLDGLIAAAGE